MAAIPPTVELGILATSAVVAVLGTLLWLVRLFYGDSGTRPDSPPPAHGRDRRPDTK
jgi:hypothetical protein